MTLPAEVRHYPEAIAEALSRLRIVGVNGPYSVLLGADAYTALDESSDHGHPVLDHIKRLIDGEIIWAPAIICSLGRLDKRQALLPPAIFLANSASQRRNAAAC